MSKETPISKGYIADRALHWISAILLLLMLLNLSSQLHNVDWDIKGQVEHRQDAVEMHAIFGVVLVVVTLIRLALPRIVKVPLKRIVPKSPRHSLFITATHIAMYTCIFMLAGTGVLLVSNYEIPLSIFGVDLAPDREAFYGVFPDVHVVHMHLKQSIWWLIAIHFAGIMYAKR
ncbi:hypothetical protein EYS00_08455 [Alteromonas sp. KUL49]|nr:hypothetical protein EYS00_08455 [Alteromonas sp. KUL49]